LRSGNSPARIVSLAPNLTEILFALELDEKIVGVSNNSDYPAAAANKKKVGSFWQPNIETIIAAKPDLVVTLQTRTEQQKSVSDSLRRLGFKVLTLKIEKIEELFTAIREVGKAADCRQLSDEVVKNISSKLNIVQSKVSSLDKVRVLWVVQVEPLRVAGRNTFINELIELAGGENAIGPTISQYPQIGTEELLACGAEVIIQSAMGKSNISEQQKAAERFWSRRPTLPAVKNNRIYVIEADTALRLGPRLPEGTETIAKCLHPDSFERTENSAQQSGPTI
jgi:iron complex transport system substrate-binding protein